MAGELKFGNKVVFLSGEPMTLPVSASDPMTAVNGDFYYNSSTDKVRVYQGGSWEDLATGSGGVGAGTAGRLTLYASTSSTVDDVYQQNSQNISVNIIAQPTRSAGILYTIPNPGDAVAAADFVLTAGNQTIAGNKTFSGTTNLSAVSASLPLKVDASKNIISAPIDLGTFEVGGVLPLVNGGTASSALLNNNRIMQSFGGAMVEAAAITASRALISDSNGIPTHSTVTNTELSYVSGVTSAIQTQLNTKALDSAVIKKDGSVTYTANQPMGGFKLTGLAAGSGSGDSVRYEQAILASGVNAWSANQSLGGFKITNSADPSSAQDLATKAYVDAVSQGLRPKTAVRAASTANIDLSSALVNGATFDNYMVSTGDRFLVKNQSLPEENGIYIVAASGAASRATDMDSLTPIDEINGAYTFIQSGDQAGQGWVEQSLVSTLGTDPMVWVYFNSIGTIIGGDMITVTGSTISVDLATVSGLESTNPGNSAGQLRIKLEASNPSLRFTGSNELAAKLDPAGTITTGTSGLIVGVDDSTIAISSNQLIVKTGGITDTQVNASAAIALTKLAALTIDRALQSNGSGFISVSATTSTELGYLSGVTSAVQTQLNGKASTALSNLASVAINASLLPGLTNMIDIGSSSFRWANTHSTSALLYGITSGAITLSAADTTTSYTVKWPSAQGGADAFVKNDGSGNLSWTTISQFTGRVGSQSIGNASTSQAVTFSSTLGTTNYAISVVIRNTTDANVQFQPVTITARSATGFTATWNAPTDSANYVLEYIAILNA